MAAALLRHGAAARRQLGAGSMVQRAQQQAEAQRRLLAARAKRAPEEITRDIQRKQKELFDAIDEGRRSLMAATNWRTQEGLFDAIAEVRMSLIQATLWSDKGLFDKFKRLKRHQIAWELIELFPGRKIVTLVFMTTGLVTLVSAAIEVKKERK